MLGIHQAGVDPLGLFLPIVGQLDVIVGLEAAVHAERVLAPDDANAYADNAKPQTATTKLRRNHIALALLIFGSGLSLSRSFRTGRARFRDEPPRFFGFRSRNLHLEF